MHKIKIRNRKITKIGNGYHFHIPIAFVTSSDLIEEGKYYDIEIIIKKEGEGDAD